MSTFGKGKQLSREAKRLLADQEVAGSNPMPTTVINFGRTLALRVYSGHSVKCVPAFDGRGPPHRSRT